MAVDLHTHSTASDGSDLPNEVVAKAARSGLSALALTDHDTLEGIEAARSAATEAGIELIPGVELSLQWEPGAMHLIVLFLEPGQGRLQNRLSELQSGREQRNRAMVERINELGLAMDYEEILIEAGGGSVGRPHIAAVMVRHGFVDDIPSAFQLFLAKGQRAYVGRPRLEPDAAIDLARQEGAVPVLAHPHTLGLNTSEEVSSTLRMLSDAGLIGMECYYPTYSPLEREGYAALARRFGLIPSGGSDYHGAYKVGIELGTGRGDLSVPETVLEELRPR